LEILNLMGCMLFLVICGGDGTDAADTLGVDLPPRVRDSQELKRWKALVQEADDSLGLDTAGERKLRQALVLAEKVDPNGPLHAVTLIKLGSRCPELELTKRHEEVRSYFTKAVRT